MHVCEQGRNGDVVFEQGLNCGGYNVVCPPVEGLMWVVCSVVVYGGMSPHPSSIHSDKELCEKITSGFCVNCSQLLSVRGFFLAECLRTELCIIRTRGNCVQCRNCFCFWRRSSAVVLLCSDMWCICCWWDNKWFITKEKLFLLERTLIRKPIQKFLWYWFL